MWKWYLKDVCQTADAFQIKRSLADILQMYVCYMGTDLAIWIFLRNQFIQINLFI